MNSAEAKRFAHMIVAQLVDMTIEGSPVSQNWRQGPDADTIVKHLELLAEHHRRFSPKKHDRPPREREYTGERLPLEENPVTTD